jgi:hypothetical protein
VAINLCYVLLLLPLLLLLLAGGAVEPGQPLRHGHALQPATVRAVQKSVSCCCCCYCLQGWNLDSRCGTVMHCCQLQSVLSTNCVLLLLPLLPPLPLLLLLLRSGVAVEPGQRHSYAQAGTVRPVGQA